VFRVDKRYIYNTPDTGCLDWSAIDRTLQWTIDRKHTIVETCQKYGHDICHENNKYKRPCNLLSKIQNVFINGKQVKTDKITQIIP